MEVLVKILTVGAAMAAGSFVVLFATLARWRDSEMGRHVMAFMNVAGILLSLAILHRFELIPRPVQNPLRAVCYAALNWVMWWRVYLLLKFQSERKANK